MIRTQRSVFDHCASPATGDVCSFLETWDDAVDPAVRVHTFQVREKVCSIHAATTPLIGYTRCYDESIRRMKVWSQLLATKAGLTIDQLFANLSYDSSGVLTANASALGFTQAQRTSAQNWCDTNLGAGKVLIV